MFETHKSTYIELENKLFKIERSINQNIHTVSSSGLLDGKSGIVLFYYELYVYTHDEKYYNICIELLYDIINNLGKTKIELFYYNGLAGIAWLVEFLISNDILDRNNSLLGQIKALLIECIHSSIKNNNYELISGTIGYIMPFIKANAQEDLNTFYSLLRKKRDTTTTTNKWISIDYNTNEKVYCFGLAHGMAGIIKLISSLKASNLEDSIYHDDLNKLYNFYVNSIENKISTISLLPNWVNTVHENTLRSKSRLAWCHGDVGAGISFLQTGTHLDNPKLKEIGNLLLINSSQRTDLDSEKIIDCSICHGTLGLTYIFHKAYQIEKSPHYRNAFFYWLNKSIELSQNKNETAGFSFHFGKYGWQKSYGILNGIAGSGLIILSLLNENCSDWDECIMLNSTK